jgi:hypothetical protein
MAADKKRQEKFSCFEVADPPQSKRFDQLNVGLCCIVYRLGCNATHAVAQHKKEAQ